MYVRSRSYLIPRNVRAYVAQLEHAFGISKLGGREKEPTDSTHPHIYYTDVDT